MRYTPHSTEAELVQGCRSNDRLAQKYLYQRFFGQMMGICMRYTGQHDEAVDVLNRAFLKVFNAIGQYEPTGRLGGWIAKIVFNTAIDYVRQQQPRTSELPPDMDVASIEPESLEMLLAEDVYALIQSLPSSNRAVFSLYYIDGYKHREIAEMLGININTCKWHLASAKKDLQQLLRLASEK
jgi:RNA polymerase sigma factor (sigma-70 family)